MNQKKKLSILEFSRLTGISRDNLRFYDRIGLLCPEQRGENNYRYYARHQLNSAYLIGSLRLLEVGLEDIRHYSAGRTPERMLALFARQEERIQAEIARLRETSEIMKLRASLAREALAHADGEVLVEERPRERIFLCPPPPEGMSDEESESFAYEYAAGKGVHLGHPAGVLITPDSTASGEPVWRYRLYFKTGGRRGNAWKPAGRYAVAYGRSIPDDFERAWAGLHAFLASRSLRPTGSAYGELLLDELSVQDTGDYFGRLEVPVAVDSCLERGI